MVPPVPMLTTTWVTRPAVLLPDLGPGAGAWDAGLCGLAYWLGMNAPGVLAVSRRATE